MQPQVPDLQGYRQNLSELRELFVAEAVATWPETISRWLRQLDRSMANTPALCKHIHRSWFACGGMGSMADVVFSSVSANERLGSLVATLCELSAALSSELGCPALSRSNRPVA